MQVVVDSMRIVYMRRHNAISKAKPADVMGLLHVMHSFLSKSCPGVWSLWCFAFSRVIFKKLFFVWSLGKSWSTSLD